MKKGTGFETVFLLISVWLIILIILTTSLLVNFIASRLSQIFAQEPQPIIIQRYNIDQFEKLTIFKKKGV